MFNAYWTYIIVMGLSLVLSAFFSSAEIAFTAVNVARLEQESKKGVARAKRALMITKNFNSYSSALLFGNGLVNIFNTAIATLFALEYVSIALNISSGLATTLMAFLIFILIVTFGEIIPKIIARNHSYRFVLRYQGIVILIRMLFFPIVYIVQGFVGWILQRWFTSRKETKDKFNDEELEKMVDTIEAKGLIDEKKGELIRSAIMFSETKAYEVMTPRIDIFAFDLEEDPQNLLSLGDTLSYSRIVVYDQTLDKIVGILPTKRLYKRLLNKTPIDLQSLLIAPLYVPRTMELPNILKIFKEQKQNLAIVVDEHGGTEGIVTLEDIAEELVGEIWDETDDIQEPMIRQSEYEYLVEGNMNIEDLFDALHIRFEPTSDYATVSGWVLNVLGQFAKVGDQFDYQHIHVTVIEVEKFTVEKIKVVVTPPQEETKENS
jgi:putative hemolysin